MEFGRLMVAMATPFKKNLDIDMAQAASLAKKIIAQGADSLVVSGTTGEGPTLSREEKTALLRTVKAAIQAPVMANVGTNDTRASIQYAKDAEESGADGILIVAPYYNKPDQKMLYDHFAAVASSVQIPSMLYNVPGRCGVSIAPDTTIRLSHDIPSITMIKDAGGNLDAMTVIIRDAAKGFRAYTGEDALILPSLAIGAHGVVSVSGHLAALQIKKMIAAYLSGETAKAAVLHSGLQELHTALFAQPNPVPLKKALALCGFDAGPLRPPLAEASAEITDMLAKALRNAGLLK